MLQIGDLARRFDVPVETIRYYERAGLLAKPARTGGNYRQYTEAHAQQLAFILNCRNLDMNQEEIRELLALRAEPSRDCGDVNALIDGHIQHVTRRVRDLQRLLKDLKSLRRSCNEARSVRECDILSTLSGSRSPKRRPMGRH
jgi:Cd(II)/Pb(II)-responsive transcriptional regulator